MGQIITLTIIMFMSIAICFLMYSIGKMDGEKSGKQIGLRSQEIESIIKIILGEMYIDEHGNNVLNGGTEEYEKKWKYEIGCNYGLTKCIRILKEYM